MTDDDYDAIVDLNDIYPGAGTFRFGNSKAECQQQIDLVRRGEKSANCAPFREFKDDPDAMPVVGRCDIAANWGGSPALVLRTTRVEHVRFCDVTLDMAEAESSSYTLDGWRAEKTHYFKRNGGWSDDMPLVFEFFELVEDLDGRSL
ncbi:ASCH domain-containing protein [Loktanella sp. TSTF-M6]|uniref:ASCH domain-containing protein n=1 Tax=Loktanella gaetbuli TaxID=2881335 RepID=A0ABS8BTW2_9RHOB|nr:ASCH domain-containing protein [Loktanella gaetbuli]MCB5199170.1 ASCH domain-containing protein [Loktanella gaetbuli]